MKIKNEIVNIKIGNQNFELNNLILDVYLKRFVSSQMEVENPDNAIKSKKLTYCLLKFDTPLNFDSTSEIYNQSFDIAILNPTKRNQKTGESKIVVEHIYEMNDTNYFYASRSRVGNIKDYYNRKITAIGFNNFVYPYNEQTGTWKFPVCSIVDTSNYNIYLQENQDFVVSRRDVIESDSLFYSSDIEKVSAPVHLCPYRLPQIINQPTLVSNDGTSKIEFNDTVYGVLYSIGLSSYPDYIDKEFIVGRDVEAVNNGTEIQINGIENYFETNNPLYPDEKLYPSDNLYPIKSNYKYLILKYKVWQLVHSGTYDEYIATPTDTKEYYYQAILIDKIGDSNLKIKYERGNNNVQI